MKFLSGILSFKVDKLQIKVNIPSYHRAALGLITGTKIYVYPRKTENEVPNSNQKLDIREVVVSQFKPNKWEYIWKLDISAFDRPGLTRKVTEILEKLEVNIFIQESLIANYEQDFTISIIADFKKYFEKLDEFKIDTPEEIKSRLEDEFKPTQGEYDFGIKVQKIEPIKFLTSISEKEVSKKTDGEKGKNRVDANALQYYYDAASAIPVDEVGITLEQHLIQNLKIPDFANSAGVVEGTMFSDTEEKYLIIRFFPRSQKVVHLEVIHPNLGGAIHTFTNEINNAHKEYNIISSYNRIDTTDIFYAHWNVLIDVTSDPRKLPDLIRALGKDFKDHDVVVLRRNYSDSLKAENISELGESEKDKRIRLKGVGQAVVQNIVTSEIAPLQEIIVKKDLLSEKVQRMEVFERIKNFVEYNARKRRETVQFSLAFATLIYIAVNVILFVRLGWQGYEQYGYWGATIIFFAPVLFMCIKAQAVNPLLFFKKIEANYKMYQFQRFGYDNDEIKSLGEEISRLKRDLQHNAAEKETVQFPEAI